MRKTVMTTVTALFLTAAPLLAQSAYADDTGTSSSTPAQDLSGDDSSVQHGIDGSVLQPGADPNNPDDYPYLPSGMQPPEAGPRTVYPQAPLADLSSTASSGSNSTTSSSSSTGSTGTSNTVNASVYWAPAPPNPSDPSTLPDIAIGKPYSIVTQWPDPIFANGELSWPNTGQLTDGQYASLDFKDRGWVQFARQGGRSVVVNLGSVQRVDRVALDFLQNFAVGIDFPNSVTYYASNDGTTWHRLGTAWSAQGGGDYTPQSQAYTLDTHVQAQYIRAQFEDKVLSFVDELSVFGPGPNQSSDQGSQSRSDHASLPEPSLTTIMGNDYLVDPNAPGLPDVMQSLATIASPSGPTGPAGPSVANAIADLAREHVLPTPQSPVGPNAGSGQGYLMNSDPGTGSITNMRAADTGGHGALGEWTVSDFLPMIAQEDASGTPTGWLYDGYLFSYFSPPTTSTGASAWINDLFSQTTNLSALDQAVGSLKQQLKDPTYKEKVVIAIPGLAANPSNFGAIDSSGQNLDLNPKDVGPVQASINKIKVVRWYIQQVLQDWNGANLSNLSLAGFYWQPETLNVVDPLDPELVHATADTVHQNHLKFYWIPYDGAPGISEWRQLGFDDVTIQPGVSFNWKIDPATRLQSVANQAQYDHTGIEMEMHWNVLSTNSNMAITAQNKYYDYFTGGYVYGYEGSVMKTWYLNTKDLVTAYQSSNPFYHHIYDNTVQFVDGKWAYTTFN